MGDTEIHDPDELQNVINSDEEDNQTEQPSGETDQLTGDSDISDQTGEQPDEADGILAEIQEQFEEAEPEPQSQPQAQPQPVEAQQLQQVLEENQRLKQQTYDYQRKWGGLIGTLQQYGDDEMTAIQNYQRSQQQSQFEQMPYQNQQYPPQQYQQAQPPLRQPVSPEISELKEKIATLEKGSVQSQREVAIQDALQKADLNDLPYARAVLESKASDPQVDLVKEARAVKRSLSQYLAKTIKEAREERKRKAEESVESASGVVGSPMFKPEEGSTPQVKSAEEAKKMLDAALDKYMS